MPVAKNEQVTLADSGSDGSWLTCTFGENEYLAQKKI